MRPICFYAAQSDREHNRQFSRRWVEPVSVSRREIIIAGAACRKPPPRPSDRERPAPVVRTSNRPLVQATFETNASNNSGYLDRTEVRQWRAAAEALFASGGAR